MVNLGYAVVIRVIIFRIRMLFYDCALVHELRAVNYNG